MNRLIGAVFFGLMPAILAPSAWAQPKPGKEQPPAENYFTFSQAEIGDQDVAIDGLVRYRRTGNRPPELSIDVCFPVRPERGEIDRFAGPLTVQKGVMSASGPSLVGGARTELSLTTAIADRRVKLNGEIRVGDTRIAIRDQSVDYLEGSADHLFEGASRTSLQAPNEIVTRLELRAVRPLMDVLRRHRALVQPAQLMAGCSDYREGKQTVRVLAAPARMAALTEAIKAIPGVVSVEPPIETSVREDGIRLPEKLASTGDRALVDRFAALAGRALGADGTIDVRANDATGEHVVILTRGTRVAKALGLSEAVVVTLLVGTDPYDQKKRMLYIMQVGSRFVDPSPTPLQLSQELSDTTPYTDIQPRRLSAMLSAAFAAEIGGEVASGSGAR